MAKRLGSLSNWLMQLLNVLLAICLSFMWILVFVNVVLRYIFNSGITWSEEMARFLFIWLTFLGAIVALKDNEHLIIDLFVKRLPSFLRKIVYILSHVLVLYCLGLILIGSWEMTVLNANAYAPATGLPMSYVYGIGVVMSIGMGVIVLYNLSLVFRGKTSKSFLPFKSDSEERMLLEQNKERISK